MRFFALAVAQVAQSHTDVNEPSAFVQLESLRAVVNSNGRVDMQNDLKSGDVEQSEGIEATLTWTLAGCPTNEKMRQLVPLGGTLMDGSFTAAVRCCHVDSDTKIKHKAYGSGFGAKGCKAKTTYAEAKKLCEQVGGRRLCTRAQLEHGVTCGAGCSFDKVRIWSLYEPTDTRAATSRAATTTITATIMSTTTPAPSPSPSPTPGGGGDSDQWLRKTNAKRSDHGACPVTWNDVLAADMLAYLKTLKSMKHDKVYELKPPHGPCGENLAWASNGTSVDVAIKGWYNEVNYCANPIQKDGCQQPKPGKIVGHFTSMVWKGAREMGCAVYKHFAGCRYMEQNAEHLTAQTPNMDGAYVKNVGAKGAKTSEC